MTKKQVCTGVDNQEHGMGLPASTQQQPLGNIATYKYSTCTGVHILQLFFDYIGRRKKRCFNCSGCLAADCGTCKHCLDKPKFGGKGLKKQCCVKRKCIRILGGNWEYGLSCCISSLLNAESTDSGEKSKNQPANIKVRKDRV